MTRKTYNTGRLKQKEKELHLLKLVRNGFLYTQVIPGYLHRRCSSNLWFSLTTRVHKAKRAWGDLLALCPH